MASIGGFSLTDWIPSSWGGPSDRGRAQPTPSPGMRWYGDTQLPDSYSLNDAGKGWYDVMDANQRVGVIRPGGPNGRFNADSSYVRPLQAQMANQLRQPPQGLAQGGPTQLHGVRNENTQVLAQGTPPRNYAANPFQRQMMMSQQLRAGK